MINYDLKKIKCILFDVDGVLSQSTITQNVDGTPMRTVNIKDGYAIQLAVKRGIIMGIITGGSVEAVRKRYSSLGVQELHLGAAHKITTYEDILQRHQLTDENVLYMGDDIPDYEIMKRVGCPCCPHDACPEIRDISLYVSHIDGGSGCARDVIEQVLKAQGMWMSDNVAFGW